MHNARSSRKRRVAAMMSDTMTPRLAVVAIILLVCTLIVFDLKHRLPLLSDPESFAETL